MLIALACPAQLYAACCIQPDAQADMDRRLRPWPVVLAMVLHQLMAAAGWLAGDADQQVPPNTPGMPHHRPAAGNVPQLQQQHLAVPAGTTAVLPAAAAAGALPEGAAAEAEPQPNVPLPGAAAAAAGHHHHAGPPAGLKPTPMQPAAAGPSQQRPASMRRNQQAGPAAKGAVARRQDTQRVLVYALSQWSPLLLKACGLSKQHPQWPPEEPLISNPGPVVAVLLQAVPAVAASFQRALLPPANAAYAMALAPPAADAPQGPQAASTALCGPSTRSTPMASAAGGTASSGGDGVEGAGRSSSSCSSARVEAPPGEPMEATAWMHMEYMKYMEHPAIAAAQGEAVSWRLLLLHGMRALRLVGHELDSLPAGSGDSGGNAAPATQFGRLHQPLAAALRGLIAAVPNDVAIYMEHGQASAMQADASQQRQRLHALGLDTPTRGWIKQSTAEAVMATASPEGVSQG